MANEIDMFDDLEDCERGLAEAKTEREKLFWREQIRVLTEEIKEKYPDLAWKEETYD